MSDSPGGERTLALGAGIPLGAGLGATAALLGDAGVALGIAYGAAGGVLVGGFVSQAAEAVRSRDAWRRRLVGASLFVGLAVGALVGGVAAWSVGLAIVDGATAGANAGGVLGVLLAGIVVATGRESTRSDGMERENGRA